MHRASGRGLRTPPHLQRRTCEVQTAARLCQSQVESGGSGQALLSWRSSPNTVKNQRRRACWEAELAMIQPEVVRFRRKLR
jgi:hypothetical protein